MGLRHRWDRLTLGPRTGRVQGEWINERLTGISLGNQAAAPSLMSGRPSRSREKPEFLRSRRVWFHDHQTWKLFDWCMKVSCFCRKLYGIGHTLQCKRVMCSLTHGP